MPFGLFLLLAFSVLIFRWARRRGRSGLLWMVLLWVSGIGLGLATAYGSLFWMLANTQHKPDEGELRTAILAPTAVGMLVGAIVPLIAVSRLNVERPEKGEP
jgi:hypothetical protein